MATVTVTELRRSRMVAVLPFRRGLHSLRPPLSSFLVSPSADAAADVPRPLNRRLKVVDLGTTPLGSTGTTPTPPPCSSSGRRGGGISPGLSSPCQTVSRIFWRRAVTRWRTTHPETAGGRPEASGRTARGSRNRQRELLHGPLPDAACEVGLHRGCRRREESLSAR